MLSWSVVRWRCRKNVPVNETPTNLTIYSAQNNGRNKIFQWLLRSFALLKKHVTIIGKGRFCIRMGTTMFPNFNNYRTTPITLTPYPRTFSAAETIKISIIPWTKVDSPYQRFPYYQARRGLPWPCHPRWPKHTSYFSPHRRLRIHQIRDPMPEWILLKGHPRSESINHQQRHK